MLFNWIEPTSNLNLDGYNYANLDTHRDQGFGNILKKPSLIKASFI